VDEQVNSQRELLTSVLEANLALLSVRQNDVIKEISSWAAIITVPTFIASVYGMNFEHMPELRWRFGYPLCLLVMAVAVIAFFAVGAAILAFVDLDEGRRQAQAADQAAV